MTPESKPLTTEPLVNDDEKVVNPTHEPLPTTEGDETPINDDPGGNNPPSKPKFP